MKINKTFLETLSKRTITPFEGSDESWKHQYGKDWKEHKLNYLENSKQRIIKFKEALTKYN